MTSGTASAGPAIAQAEPCVMPMSDVTNAQAAGVKAFNLARMARLGLEVPPGFVVSCSAFRGLLVANKLDEEIATRCSDLRVTEPERIRSAAQTIQQLVLRSRIPESVKKGMRALRQELIPRGPLIVRSSAVGEDSESASFAGQLDSIPDVDSEESLQHALLACWASYWSERSLFYQVSRSVFLDGMGVVVQRQVSSRVSGVLFTRDPRSDRNVLLAEYCYGKGEALVSGKVTPGRITISRGDLDWHERAAPPQPESDKNSCSRLFGEAQINLLARTGLQLEESFGSPQDVEWTIDRLGTLYLLQSRPITVHNPPAEDRSAKGSFAYEDQIFVWSNTNLNENYPEPVSPFLFSIASRGYYHYFRNLAHGFGISPVRVRAMEEPLRGIIDVHCGRMYYNLTNVHAVLRMAPCGIALAQAFDQFVGTDLEPSTLNGASEWSDSGSWLSRLREGARIAIMTASQYAFLTKRVQAFERRVDEFCVTRRPEVLREKPLSDLLKDLTAFLNIRCHQWNGAALADAAAMACHWVLRRLLEMAFPASEQSGIANNLLKGLPHLISARPTVELWKLSRLIRDELALAELFAQNDGQQILAALRTTDRFAGFRDELDQFLALWGFRFSGELMLTLPSYQEKPAALLELLKSFSILDGPSPVEVIRLQGEERERETRRLLDELRARRTLPFAARIVLANLLGLVICGARRSIALRERARLKQAQLYGCCRWIALAIGEKLVQQGHLTGSDQVFFLHLSELKNLISDRGVSFDAVESLARSRQKRHAQFCLLTPPRSFSLPAGEHLEDTQTPELSATFGERAVAVPQLVGVGACGGRIVAPAIPLRDPSQAQLLSKGDVLVAPQTDPGWGPLFFFAGGLVLERGGVLSHGAILAREYGIPCVVGVEGAMDIPAGTTVSVDGDLGLVRLCDG